MTREQLLEILMLLSALESWGFANGQRLPEFLNERLCDCIESLRVEVLK